MIERKGKLIKCGINRIITFSYQPMPLKLCHDIVIWRHNVSVLCKNNQQSPVFLTTTRFLIAPVTERLCGLVKDEYLWWESFFITDNFSVGVLVFFLSMFGAVLVTSSFGPRSVVKNSPLFWFNSVQTVYRFCYLKVTICIKL